MNPSEEEALGIHRKVSFQISNRDGYGTTKVEIYRESDGRTVIGFHGFETYKLGATEVAVFRAALQSMEQFP